MDEQPTCNHQRREVLRSIAGIVGASGAALMPMAGANATTSEASVAKATTSGRPRRIDTHAHLWPEEYVDFLEKAKQPDIEFARGLRASSSKSDLDARFAMMDAAGVSMQILSATPQVLQNQDTAACLTGARMINDAYADLVKQYPDRFMAYGTVPLPHVDAAIAEGRRAIEQLGFAGVALTTLVAEKTIASDAFLPFYAEMNRLGAIIYLHPTGCGALSPMINDFKLEWVVGAPFEDSLVVLQLLKADIPHRFPRIKFHVAHLGGGLAFLMQRIEDNYTDWKAFPRSPADEMRKMWWDTANFHAPALRCMADSFGSDKLMLGSDFPYFQDTKYTRAVTYIRNSGLPPKVIEAILEGNARRLFVQSHS